MFGSRATVRSDSLEEDALSHQAVHLHPPLPPPSLSPHWTKRNHEVTQSLDFLPPALSHWCSLPCILCGTGDNSVQHWLLFCLFRRWQVASSFGALGKLGIGFYLLIPLCNAVLLFGGYGLPLANLCMSALACPLLPCPPLLLPLPLSLNCPSFLLYVLPHLFLLTFVPHISLLIPSPLSPPPALF